LSTAERSGTRSFPNGRRKTLAGIKTMETTCYGYLGGGTVDQVKRGFAEGDALLKFTAKWCGPCQAIHPRFVELAQESSVPCYHVDIEEDEHELARNFGITKLPTFLRLKDGKEVSRVEGANLEKVVDLLSAGELLVRS
jgi:thioredoxin 1